VSARPPDPAAPGGDLLDSAAAGPIAARGGALRAIGYGVGTLLAVISAPLMIRHLGIEDFGRYVTVVSLVTVVVGFTDAGLAAVAQREYASRSGADRDRVMRDLLGIRITLGLAAAGLAMLFAVVAGYPPVQLVGTAAIAAAFVLWSVQTVLAASLQGELRFGWMTAVELLRQGLLVAFIVALVVADAGLEAFFLAMLPATAVALALTAALVRRLMPLRPSFHPRRSWALLRDTLTYAAAVAMNAAYFRIAVVALSLLATERETGYFATAFRVMEVLVGVPLLVIGAAFPILARAARDDRRRLDSATSRLVEVGLVMGVWLALSVALAARPIVYVLAGDHSDPSIGLLRLLAVALVASFVTVACGYALLSLRRHRDILLANAAALVVSAALTLVLIPPYGATGAAVAVLAAEAVLMLCCLGALVRERPAVMAALRRAPAVLAAGGLACLVVLVPGLPPLADAVAAALVYPALLLAARRFPPEIGHALRSDAKVDTVAP
jgi:O-antigen/teichoic acid export membrane protein